MNILNRHTSMAALLLGGLVVIGLLPALAMATPMRFNINGQYMSPTSGTFHGSMVVDTATGDLLSFDALFPGAGVGDFNEIVPSYTQGISNGFAIGSLDGDGDSFDFRFTTTNTAGPFGFGSLIGFDGGTIFGYQATRLGVAPLGDFSGSITQAVPEPAEFGMFGLGVLLVGLFAGLRRRMG